MKASFNQPDQATRQSTIKALHYALDHGVTLFDTADIYAPTWDAFGHNERLVAEAMSTHPLGKSAIIATKAGITRKPGEVWGRNASLDYLLRAVEASAGRLGVERIALWQHHRLDPNMPFEQQLENLAGLKQRGLIERIGVSNYSAVQLRRAIEVIGPIATVQNQLSLAYRQDLDVLEVCEQHGIKYLPWSPMIGAHPKDASAELKAYADAHGASTYAVAVAWLKSLSPAIVPLPGVTRVESVADAISGLTLELNGEVPLSPTKPMDAELLSDQPKN
jgi:aryl-alcohol dehydrogenase-like predicted oxidoreductase